MVCCMTEKYGWCKDLPVVFGIDEAEKQYCEFHAPIGNKEKSLEEFNEHVFKRINAAIESKSDCDLSGTIFKGDIKFKNNIKDSVFPPIIFIKTQFSGEANFVDATFSEKANFDGATFNGEAYFVDTTFSGEANFVDATFSGETNFVNATFSGEVNFFDATLNRGANFVDATFSGEANFHSATFNKEAYFVSATFNRGANFGIATFNIEANFGGATFNIEANFGGTTFNGKTAFDRATFNIEANFVGATFSGEANFDRATFNLEAYFFSATFSGETNFVDATFSGEANFHSATFSGEAYFVSATFNAVANFKNLSIVKKIKFEKTNLNTVSFMDTDLRSINFLNCDFPQKSKKILFYAQKRHVLYDELVLHEEKDIDEYYAKMRKVGRLYRQMKQKYKEEHNELEVSDWHYGEKEMYRKRNPRRLYNPVGISNLYWASSGYGERPVRAGLVLCTLIFFTGILLNYFGIGLKQNEPVIQGFSLIPDIKAFGLLCLSTLQHILFVKNPVYVPVTNTGIFFITVFSKLFIPIQAALLAFSIRNKFRR